MALHEISLKWNGYQHNILSNVKELFQDEDLADCTLVSEGQSFKAHKVILSANSSVFRSIFQQNPQKDPIVVLSDVNIRSLQTLLSFMYNGEVNVTEEFLPSLLKAADCLKICGLSTVADSTDNEEPNITSPPKKRKKWGECLSGLDDQPAVPHKSCRNDVIKSKSQKIVVPKVEPVELIESDCSTSDNTSDSRTHIPTYNTSPPADNCDVCTNDDKLNEISRVSASTGCVDKESDTRWQIEKEIETVLHSGTVVESLHITSGDIHSAATEFQGVDKSSNVVCYASPVFPCPFCSRVYNSWGYRRRHVKSRHLANRLACKLCLTVQGSQAAWYLHATRSHGVAHDDARNSLVVLVEAHAVLTLHEHTLPQLLRQLEIPPAPAPLPTLTASPAADCHHHHDPHHTQPV